MRTLTGPDSLALNDRVTLLANGFGEPVIIFLLAVLPYSLMASLPCSFATAWLHPPKYAPFCIKPSAAERSMQIFLPLKQTSILSSFLFLLPHVNSGIAA